MSEVLSAVAAQAVNTPDRFALLGAWPLTYAELHVEVGATAALLQKALTGTADERPVAVALDNGPAWVITDLALASLARPVLPLPPFFTAEQRRHAIDDCGAVLVVSPSLEGGVWIGGQQVLLQPTGAGPRDLPAGTAMITYTSGSTGSPKGVCLSQDQLESVARSIVSLLGAEQAGVHLPVLPLAVLLENVAGLYSVLLAGGAYHAASLRDVGMDQPFQPDVVEMVRKVAATRATSLILVPELLRGLIAAKTALNVDLPDLRFVAVGGARVAPSLLQSAWAAGLPAYEGYGLTECGSVVALNTPGHDRHGTAGRPLAHVTLSLSEEGEVVVGPGSFLGYVGNPPQEGPFHTGDLGEFDEAGFLRITGRRRNLIITAFGRNISPEWVESELLAQPEIAQAVVHGEGEPRLRALIVPSKPNSPAEALDAAIARANLALPEYARVAAWRAVPPFDPAQGQLTGNGRPRREAILAAYISNRESLHETPAAVL